MTPAARDFNMTALSLLSVRSIVLFTNEDDEQLWNNHVELRLWADLMIVAPARQTP
jgi:phosphopantothenoylcysteine decarboxylase/phosphopantothenate--cysteine ligase